MSTQDFIITNIIIFVGILAVVNIIAIIINNADNHLPNHKLTCFESKVYVQKNKDNIHWYPLFLYNGKEYIPIECK